MLFRSCSKKKHLPEPALLLYAGYDLHSQIGLVREIITGITQKEKTVIVLPRPETLIPLLSEISSLVGRFNVSLGYPLKRTSLFVLFNLVSYAQSRRKNNFYYSSDYLELLRHPLVKNIKFSNNSAITRVLVHKIEKVLSGQPETLLGGSIFIDPYDVEKLSALYADRKSVV